jgi:hypothetical protein
LLIEAAAKKFEREHNARVWLAWHIASLQRMKKLPDIKRMYLNNTSRPQQTWRQQLSVFSEWVAKHNAAVARQKAIEDGR